MTSYDAIVLGLGGMGSAALYHLARRGARVLGLEQFGVVHDRGASHGDTRIIRKAYFEHADYVPLLQRAYVLWRELEAATGSALMELTGLVAVAPTGGELVQAVLSCAAEHRLPITRVTPDDFAAHFPQLRLPESMEALWDPEGGFLRVERCVRAHLDAARAAGAAIRDREPVLEWSARPGEVTVRTAGETHRADRLVVAAGAWSGRVLAEIGLPLEVRRKVVFWYPETVAGTHAPAVFPTFFYDLPYGRVYGSPALDAHGVKVADHTGGQILTAPEPARDVLEGDEDACQRFLRELAPGLVPQRSRHSVCMYAMTPDEHFVIGRHPAHDSVTVAAGFSGHGFKFAAVVGEVLADLALEGRTEHPIGFLDVRRPALGG